MNVSEIPFVCGNAIGDEWVAQTRGWFIGHFLPSEAGPRKDPRIEVKWGVHASGEFASAASYNQTATTVAVPIQGKYEIGFPEHGEVAVLENPGDYVLFQSNVVHTGRSLADSVIITIRWPSTASDNIKLK
jgi:hypothetical protein